MARLSWPGWLVKYQDVKPPKVTDLSTNLAQRKVNFTDVHNTITTELNQCH